MKLNMQLLYIKIDGKTVPEPISIIDRADSFPLIKFEKPKKPSNTMGIK